MSIIEAVLPVCEWVKDGSSKTWEAAFACSSRPLLEQCALDEIKGPSRLRMHRILPGFLVK